CRDCRRVYEINIKEDRLDLVDYFIQYSSVRNDISKILEKCVDIEMLCRKIQRRKAGLQDLYKIYQMLLKLPMLKGVFNTSTFNRPLKEVFVNDLQ
ncbi:DNA mismatch repair protein Msh2, partial [Nephila pilipes]